jgi:hypothetical protein
VDRKEAVLTFLNRVKNEGYIADQNQKGIRASGRSADSLHPIVEETYGKLLGAHYFAYQRVGRKPGSMPPVDAIIQWLKDKKTFLVSDDRGPGITGLAWAIAKKIAKKGTDIFLRKREGLSIEDRILEARKEFAMNLLHIEREKLTEKLKPLQKK